MKVSPPFLIPPPYQKFVYLSIRFKCPLLNFLAPNLTVFEENVLKSITLVSLPLKNLESCHRSDALFEIATIWD